MQLGYVILFLYMTADVIERVSRPKVANMIKANVYDRKSINEEIQKYGEKKHRQVKVATWLLKALGVIKTILMILIIAQAVFLVGAIITGSFFVLGHRVW